MSVWNNLGSGLWNTAANWLGGVPNANGATADFSNLANAAVTHTIDLSVMGPFKAGIVDLTSSSIEKYVLAHGGLTLQQTNIDTPAQVNVGVMGSGTPLATVFASDLTLQMNSSGNFTTNGASTVLDMQAFVTGIGALNKLGSGTLRLSNAANNYAGDTHIAQGAIDFTKAAFGSGDIEFTGASAMQALSTVTLANDIVVKTGISATLAAQTSTTLKLTGTFGAMGGSGTGIHFGSATAQGAIDFASSDVGNAGSATIYVDGGALKAGGAFDKLTSLSGAIKIASGATLDANGFYLQLFHLTGAGKITNNGAKDIVVNAVENAVGTYAGYIQDGLHSVSLNKIGAGTLTLTGINTFSDSTIVYSGELKAGADHTFSALSLADVRVDGTLNIGSFDQTIGGLKGAGLVRADTATQAVLTIDVAANDSQTFDGLISDGSAVFGSLALTKTGAGKQSLSGEQTFTGSTSIKEGTLALVLSGSIESSHDVDVAVGASLSISGISPSVAALQSLTSQGTVVLGGKHLVMTAQSGDLGGIFVGGAGDDTLHIVLDNAVKAFSLSGAAFNSWTDATDMISIKGNALDNTLTGSSHSDGIDGGEGADIMTGGAGSDVYTVDNIGDKIFEANVSGIDLVKTSVTYLLSGAMSGQYIENLTLTGVDAIDATGNALANTIVGNAAANTINGGKGADTLDGGLGDDTYIVDDAGDKVIEFSGGGADTVNAAVSFTLGASNWVEVLQTTLVSGSAAIDLTGNNIAQGIIGNNGANKISGLGGDDLLFGMRGNDTLTGGAGKDSFYFNTPLSSASNVDAITDFNPVDDTIKLANSIFTTLTNGALSPDAFFASAAGVAHDASDRILYDTDSGALFYDADGNLAGGVGAIKFAVVGINLALTNADFAVS